MTDRQIRFCESYLACGNAQQAARDAGYTTTKGHCGYASRVLQSSVVKAYLAKRFAEIEGKNGIASAEEVMEFLSAVMRGEEVDFYAAPKDGRVVYLRRPPTLKERITAANMLGKRYALFTERISIEEAPKIVFSEVDIPD